MIIIYYKQLVTKYRSPDGARADVKFYGEGDAVERIAKYIELPLCA